MIIPIPEPLLQLTPEQEEQMYWNRWAFDSHKWIEYSKGYYQCEFCHFIHTSVMPIGDHIKVCQNNPKLKQQNNEQ